MIDFFTFFLGFLGITILPRSHPFPLDLSAVENVLVRTSNGYFISPSTQDLLSIMLSP